MNCVYLIWRRSSGRAYVGATRQGLAVRWNAHKSAARGVSERPLHKDMRAFGSDAFDIAILEETSFSDLLDAEQRWILEYQQRAPGIYNLFVRRPRRAISCADNSSAAASLTERLYGMAPESTLVFEASRRKTVQRLVQRVTDNERRYVCRSTPDGFQVWRLADAIEAKEGDGDE